MTQGFLIEADAVYDNPALQAILGMGPDALSAARKHGDLRFTRKGRRIFYLGQWILDWLEGDAQHRHPAESAHA